MLEKHEVVETERGILAELEAVDSDLIHLSGSIDTLLSRISPVLENGSAREVEAQPNNAAPSADSELILTLRELKSRIRAIDKEVISITNRVQL